MLVGQKIFGIKALNRLIAGVNFTNILRAAFSYESFFPAFMCLQFGFVIFWRKDFATKAEHKMLVKLTPGIKRFNIFMPKIRLIAEHHLHRGDDHHDRGQHHQHGRTT